MASEQIPRLGPSQIVREWQAGTLAKKVRRRVVEVTVERVQAAAYREIAELLLRRVGAQGCLWVDARGGSVRGARALANLLRLALDAVALPWLYVKHALAVRGVFAMPGLVSTAREPRTCLYLRQDHNFDLASGGSVAHTAGIINSFRALLSRVTVVSSDRLRLVAPDDDFHELVPHYKLGRNIPGMPLFSYSEQMATWVQGHAGVVPDFIYARCSLGNYAAPLLRRSMARPYVCEYNGSVAWIARNWGGRPLRFERLFDRVEMLNLCTADLVIAVSEASKNELLARGIDEQKILVNPNGVDADLYSPALDGEPLRRRLGIASGECVIGFIGTFGPWHGCEVLARAFCRMLEHEPQLRDRRRLLLIGDGQCAAAVKELLTKGNAQDRVVHAGVVEQADAPGYLAACDVLVSPHVPNPDGSAFFGSPTKLFEYMAMGKAIVASALDQIGEVLEDGQTAMLVEPGNDEELARTLREVCAQPETRARLGAAARREVLAHYTWEQHAARVLQRLASDGDESPRTGRDAANR